MVFSRIIRAEVMALRSGLPGMRSSLRRAEGEEPLPALSKRTKISLKGAINSRLFSWV